MSPRPRLTCCAACSFASGSDKPGGVSRTEQTSLEGRIDGNGEVDEYDAALLAFLAEESGFSRE